MASVGARYVSVNDDNATYTADGTELGKGAFGVVFAGTRDQDALQVAIKSETTYSEATIMLALRDKGGHDNLMQLVDVVKQVEDPCQQAKIVVERMDYTLWEWTFRYKKKHGNYFSRLVPDKVKQEVVRQHYAGLAFMHSNGVTHSDIHSGNVMVQIRSGCVKICDFGNSSFHADDLMSPMARDKFRLTDLRASAALVATPLWLRRHYTQGKQRAVNEFHGEHAPAALDNVYSTLDVTQLVAQKHDWWETIHEDFRSNILAVSAFNLENAEYGGVPMTPDVAEILKVSLLYAPYEDCVAEVISSRFDAMVSPSERAEAQEFIRQT